jgi:hypothetical protein
MKGDMGWLFIAVGTLGAALFTLTDHRLMGDLPAAWARGQCDLMGLATVPFKYAAIAAGIATIIYWITAAQDGASEPEGVDDE